MCKEEIDEIVTPELNKEEDIITNYYQEDKQKNAAEKIQKVFRAKNTKKKIIKDKVLSNLINKLEKENNNIKVETINEDEFEAKLQELSYIPPIIEKYKNELKNLKYKGKEKLYEFPCIKLKDISKGTTEYSTGECNGKGEVYGKIRHISEDNSYYEGLVENNEFEGKGLLIQPDGSYYYGDWKKGQCEGEGELNLNNHSHYIGHFSKNMRNGYGKEEFSDKSTYEGNYVNNEKEGKGKYTFEENSYYEGDFKESKFDGEGVYCWSDGRKYEGQFKNGLMNGKGIHYWEDGDIYRGSYLKSKKNGQGAYTWNNGNTFLGNFVNNEPHGDCILEEKDSGNKYQIIFRHGKIISSRSSNPIQCNNTPNIEDKLVFQN